MSLKHLIKTLSLVSVIILLSCEPASKPTTPQSSPNFEFLKLGSYWVYNSYVIDYNFNKISANSIDSIVVAAHYDYTGTRVYELHHFRNDNIIDTLVFSNGHEELYQLNRINHDSLFYFDGHWIKVADFNKDSWFIVSDIRRDIYVEEKTNKTFGDVDIVMNGNFDGIEDLELADGFYKTYKFKISGDTRLTIDSGYVNTYTNEKGHEYKRMDSVHIRRYYKYSKFYWINELYGIMKIQDTPYLHKWSSEPSIHNFTPYNKAHNGRIYELLRFKVPGIYPES